MSKDKVLKLSLPSAVYESALAAATERGVSVERYIETMVIWFAPIKSTLWNDVEKK